MFELPSETPSWTFRAPAPIARILICREKHAILYYDATSDPVLHAASLKILGDRLGDGYWYDPGPAPPKPGGLDDEQLAELGVPAEDPSRVEARESKARFHRSYAEWQQAKNTLDRAQAIALTKDGARAWRFLQSRRSFEYEGVELVWLESVPNAGSGS